MPNTRTKDPVTSYEAAASVTGLAGSYAIILQLFREYGPMNDEALIRAWRYENKKYASDSGIRSRRSELVATGKIIDTGERMKMASGRNSIIWDVDWANV